MSNGHAGENENGRVARLRPWLRHGFGRRALPAAVALATAATLAGSSATGASPDTQCYEDGIYVSTAAVVIGDTGDQSLTFAVERLNPGCPLSIAYATNGNGTASPADDFTSTASTLSFGAGETDGTFTVPVTGDSEGQTVTVGVTLTSSDANQPFVSYDGTRTFGQANVTGTIYYDGGLPYDVIAKTGAGLTSINQDVSINDKGDVAFSGTGSQGNGLFAKIGDNPVTDLTPGWGNRQFENGGIDDNDNLVAWDQLAGAPPEDYIRTWRPEPVFGQSGVPVYDQTVDAGPDTYNGVGSPTMSDTGHYAYFGYTYGQGTVVADDAGGTSRTISIPHPIVDDNGDVLFREVDGDLVNSDEIANAPINLYDPNFVLKAQVACPTSCAQSGFTNLGEQPGLSGDGQVVAFYAGAYTPPQGSSVKGGPGIYASIDTTASGRKLVAIAHVGDGGITAFEPDSRISVNSTQATQHAVTIAFLADDKDGKAIYTVRLTFTAPQSGAFDPANPAGFSVGDPVKIAGVGDAIEGLGKVSDLAVDDALNDQGVGDIAFWAASGDTQAVVRAPAPTVPLLFVPGIAGSQLHVQGTQPTDEAWLGPRTAADNCNAPWFVWLPDSVGGDQYKFLGLRQSDWATGALVPSGPVRCTISDAASKAQDNAGMIYKPLLDSLQTNGGYKLYDLGVTGENERTCDLSQKPNNPSLFVFPYDWRLGNAYNAANLNAFMACVKAFYPDTKVNVLTHSMGGLLTRRTLLQYPSFAGDVNALLSLMPPWLGAPKLPYALLTGDFAPPVAYGSLIKCVAASLPGAHDLFPSRSYFADVAGVFGGRPIGEVDANLDSNGDLSACPTQAERPTGLPPLIHDLSYDEMVSYFDEADPEFDPGSVGEAFHDYGVASNVTQDDASGDDWDFPFYEIYGVQKDRNTIGEALWTTEPECMAEDGKKNCIDDNYMNLLFTTGDGTVPTVSAARPGMQPADATTSPIDASSPVDTDPDSATIYEADQATSSCCAADAHDFDHNGIVNNTDVEAKILQIFGANGGPPPPSGTTNARMMRASARLARTAKDDQPPDVSMRSIAVLGAGPSTVADGAGNTTAPQTDQDTGDQYSLSLPDATVYHVNADNDDVLVRSEAAQTLTTTFTSTGGPIEVDVITDDDSGTTSQTKFMDVGLPSGTNVQLQTTAGQPPALAYDSNGDGSYDTTIAPTVSVTGAAAADATPPTVTDTVERNADGTVAVTLTATDDGGAGMHAVYYSLDGQSYDTYPGSAVDVDPTQSPDVWFFADDNAGNRSAPVEIPLLEPAGDTPTAAAVAATTNENAAAQVKLAGSSPRNAPLTYEATQPAHGTVTVSGDTATYTPAHDYHGTDTFTYTADDGLAASSPATVTVTVTHVNQPPEVTITAPATANEGGTVTLSATVTDPDGDTFTLGSWTASSGSIDGSGTSATLTAGDGPATITVGLTATDANGATGKATATIQVQNVAPTVAVKAVTGGYWGVPLAFSGSATDPSAADTSAGFSYTWDFGDGQKASGATATHAYARAGSFTAALSATDKDGGAGTASTPVTIRQRPARLAYTGSTSAAYGSATLSAQLSDAYNPATAQLSGHRVIFSLGRIAYAAYTDSTGTATVQTSSPIPPGSYTVNVLFSADQLYASSFARTTLAVTDSAGTASGTGLVPATGGTASFTATSTGTSVSGTLSYSSGSTTVQATLGVLGISADGHDAWLSGIDSLHRTIAVYVEDHGASGDVFELWINGQPVTGSGALTAGDVAVQSG